jgi:tetratricopeptide (TPR) repeat protein
MTKGKMTIRKKILITFVLLIVIPVIVLSGLNIAGILLLSRDNADVSSEALRVEELDNLQQMANDTTLSIKEEFERVSDEATVLADYSSDLFNGKISAEPRDYYYWDKTVYTDPIPGLYNDPNYGIEVSFEVSCYYIPPSSMNASYDDLDATAETVLDISSNIDSAFKMLHEANPNYIWFSAGFQAGGLYKNYPYNNLDFFYYPDPGEEAYDPRDRPWYQDAIGEDDVVFTSPYLDPTSGLMISVARELRYDNGSLIGAVSMDLTIDTVRQTITNMDISDDGYAFLIDSEGKTIAHPNIPDPIPDDYEAEDIIDMVFDTGDSSSKNDFQTTIDLMKGGDFGQATFMKNDGQEKWYIVYAPIEITGYSVGIVVPESDIIGPANAVQTQINRISLGETFIFVAVLVAIIILVVIFASIISRRIVEPIKQMTQMVEYITAGDLSREMKTEAESYSKEISILHSAFQNLVTTLRFGNTDYYRGDLERAHTNYTRALELFKTTKNKRGQGICYNNLGNIYRSWGDYKKAEENYRRAISIGEKMDDKLGLASRYNNLGLLFLEKEELSQAKDNLEKALAFDEEIDNHEGIATRLENLGLYYSRIGKKAKAKEYYEKAIKLSKKHDLKRELAHAYLNQGIFFIESGDYSKAKQSLEDALEIAKKYDDIRLVANCYEQLAIVYTELNEKSKAHKAKSKAAEIQQSMVNKKEVLFVFDYSGSMRGSKMKAAIQGALEIIKTQINPQDEVSIVIFNEMSKVILPLTIARNSYELFERTLRRLRTPQYRTAFYDALGDAITELNQRTGNQHKWVIALTDGLDNASNEFTIDKVPSGGLFRKSSKISLHRFLHNTMLNANLIIVAVGDELQAVEFDLKKLCDETPRGKYIGISSRMDASKAIREAFHEVKDLMAQVDIEGFDIDEY